jgi:hypothetical protein
VAGSLAGDFIWSLTYTDIFSGWTEGGAVWNKGAAGVLAATREVEERLPFALLGFDSDNGGEFLNHHLWSYMRERNAGGGVYPLPALPLRRQRACGAKELDVGAPAPGVWPAGKSGVGGPDQRAVSGSVGAVAEFLFALFEAGARKWREGSHWRKRYELPKTAYHRLCAPGMLALKARRALRDRYESLDPFALKEELETKLKQILKPKPNGGLLT